MNGIDYMKQLTRRTLLLGLWLAYFVLGAMPLEAGFAKEVAITLDLSGSVKVITRYDGFTDKTSLGRAVNLYPGQQVELGRGAKVVLMRLDDFQKVTVKGPNQITIQSGGLKVRHGALPGRKQLAAADKKIMTQLGKGRVGGIRLRNVGARGASIKLVAPVQGATLLKAQPSFQWRPLRGVKGYRFELLDDRGKVVVTQTLSRTHVDWPRSLSAAPGARYQWRITAQRGDKQISSATQGFSFATQDQRRQLARFEPKRGASLADQVFYAILLERLGMQGAARDQWRMLAKKRPKDPFFRKKAR